MTTEADNLYDLKKTADILGLTYAQVYKYVFQCQKCGLHRKECKCRKFKPILQSIDVGGMKSKRIRHRIDYKTIEGFKKSRIVK